MEAHLVGGDTPSVSAGRGPNVGVAMVVHTTDKCHFPITLPNDRDVIVKLANGVTPADLRGKADSGLRLASLFVDLTILAREDSSLAALLSRFKVEVVVERAHGVERLWPPTEEGR